jgi:hypothetical protein
MESSMEISLKTKNTTAIRSVIALLSIYVKNISQNTMETLEANDYRSTIHNSQAVNTTQMP